MSLSSTLGDVMEKHTLRSYHRLKKILNSYNFIFCLRFYVEYDKQEK